jgi:hypothetical protein
LLDDESDDVSAYALPVDVAAEDMLPDYHPDPRLSSPPIGRIPFDNSIPNPPEGVNFDNQRVARDIDSTPAANDVPVLEEFEEFLRMSGQIEMITSE